MEEQRQHTALLVMMINTIRFDSFKCSCQNFAIIREIVWLVNTRFLIFPDAIILATQKLVAWMIANLSTAIINYSSQMRYLF